SELGYPTKGWLNPKQLKKEYVAGYASKIFSNTRGIESNSETPMAEVSSCDERRLRRSHILITPQV
ncbi:hypothetical protein PJO48_29440, partial [Mycobacterium kansasii]